MKLRNLFYRGTASAIREEAVASEVPPTASGVLPHARRGPADGSMVDNVVPLHPIERADASSSLPSALDTWPPVEEPAPAGNYRGVLDEPEIARFLAHNYWAFGRSHGARAHSQHALELELDAVTAKFHNVLLAVAAQRRSKLHRARHYRVETQGGNPTLTAQLELAEANQEREVRELEAQASLAAERKGWVLQAVNQFRLGFDQGVREHLEFHQIFG